MLRVFSSRLARCLKQENSRCFNTAASRSFAFAPSVHAVGLPSVRHGRDSYRHMLEAGRRMHTASASLNPETKPQGDSTPTFATSSISDAHKNLITQRRFMESNATAQTFHIAGVSFGDRQEHVQQLGPKQAVMLIREPWCPFDPKAVAVFTVGGVSLGYIPKEFTQKHRHEWANAHIVSTGNATPDLLGVLVSSRPTLRSMSVQTLPTKHAAKYANLASLYPPSVWREMRERAIENVDHTCEVTGITAEEAELHVLPSWRYNDAAKQVQLAGWMVVCADVRKAAASIVPGTPVLITAPNVQLAQQVQLDDQLLFMDLLEWDEIDIEEYVGFLADRQAKMDNEDWGVVLEVKEEVEDTE